MKEKKKVNRVRGTGGLHEQSFNLQLAQVLRESNIRWRSEPDVVQPERTGTHGRVDIRVVDTRMPTVAIECAYGGDNEKDAQSRLDKDPTLNTAVAVAIPRAFQSFTENEALAALRAGQQLRYAILQRETTGTHRFPMTGYIFGTAADLATLIQLTSATKQKIEQVASTVAGYVDQAATFLSVGFKPNAVEMIAGGIENHTVLSSIRTVAILWLDAFLVQSHLHANATSVEGVPVEVIPAEGFATGQVIRAWRHIQSLNWASVFEPAVEALIRSAEESRRTTARALEHLIRAADEVESSKLGMHLEVGAELFPRILEDRKEVAAFYTTPATAELLCTLLIRREDPHDWSDCGVLRDLRIADLACGTGTLVRAAYRRIRTFLEVSGASEADLSVLHKDAMEYAITAADISPIAAHLTNSSMAMMGHGEPYTHTNIGWVSVGESVAQREAEKTAGSLEFLAKDDLVDMFSNLGHTAGGEKAEAHPIRVERNSLDYVVMNPPYSRTRGGQSAFDLAGLTTEQRTQCQKRWATLLKNHSAKKTAGMAASFLCLAREKVKPGGRIGFVLPLSAAFDKSWGTTREMILSDFKDIVAVTRGGRDDKESLSADTHLAEMLLVATRQGLDERPADRIVKCVVLTRMPVRIGEAGEYARSIESALVTDVRNRKPVFIGDEEVGRIVDFSVEEAEEPWSHLGVLNPDLAIASRTVAQGVLTDIFGSEFQFSIKMSTLGEVFRIGPTHHLIGHPLGSEPIGGYTFFEITRPAERIGPDRALWRADAERQRTLETDPTHRGVVYNEERAENVRDTSGTLHYARGIQWTSQALVAASTRYPVYGGSAWTTLIHSDERIKAAFAIWANSTLGLITHWTKGGRTQRGRSRMQVAAIARVPCPNFNELEPDAIEAALSRFRALRDKPLRPTCEAHVDEVRHQLDVAVVEMLELPREKALTAISHLRNWWCAEPTVHGYKRRALKLLREADLID